VIIQLQHTGWLITVPLSVAGRKKPPSNIECNPPTAVHADMSSIGTPVPVQASASTNTPQKKNFAPMGKEARGPMQQMKLCGNSADPSAPARMDIAIADFIHSRLLPFSIASEAKLPTIIEIAKQLGQTYTVCIS
jgi:hypothetical protein